MHFEKEVGESLTYKFAQAAGEMRAQGREIISLGLGEPDFRTPDYVLEATMQAMRDGFTHYSATQGWPELRRLIAERRIDAVVWNQFSFDEIYDLEYTFISKQLEAMGIPVIKLESGCEESEASLGRLMTKTESFVEAVGQRYGQI